MERERDAAYLEEEFDDLKRRYNRLEEEYDEALNEIRRLRKVIREMAAGDE